MGNETECAATDRSAKRASCPGIVRRVENSLGGFEHAHCGGCPDSWWQHQVTEAESRGNALSLALDARNAEVRELKAERAALRKVLVHATQHGAANMSEIESVLATVDAREKGTDARMQGA